MVISPIGAASMSQVCTGQVSQKCLCFKSRMCKSGRAVQRDTLTEELCKRVWAFSTHQIAPRPFPGGMMHGEPLFNWAQPFNEGHSRRGFTLQSGGSRPSSQLRSVSILRWTA